LPKTNATFVKLIEFTLTAYAGHQVFKAANGAEAVELAPQVMP